MLSPETPIIVTGVSGFVGSHVAARLLSAGKRVRGTTRNPAGPDSALLGGLPGAADRLEIVAADLLDERGLEAAVAGAGAVVHTASPYVLDVTDVRRDLVDPAVEGTRRLLHACARHPEVRRVVLTSSMAAITDEPDRDRILTEDDWNTRSTVRRNPYYLSKTLAERAAWAFVAAERPEFDLVAINPFMVVGPSFTPRLNTSNKLLADILTGGYPGILGLSWGFVDVGDVAEAHLQALERADAGGRYICAGDVVSMRTLVGWLRSAGYGRDGNLPTRRLDGPTGNLAVRLASFTRPVGLGSYLRTHIGRTPRYDTARIRRELGLSFRPARESILDAAADLERWGHVPPRGVVADARRPG